MDIKRNSTWYVFRLSRQKNLDIYVTGSEWIYALRRTAAPYYNDDGVLVMSVYDFLLNEGSLDNWLVEKFVIEKDESYI